MNEYLFAKHFLSRSPEARLYDGCGYAHDLLDLELILEREFNEHFERVM